MKTILIVGVVLAGLAIVGVGAFFVLNMGTPAQSAAELRQTPYYRVAAQQISLDSDVLAALGQPLEFGAAEVKSRSGDDDQGSVLLDIQVKGPNGAGHGQVKVAKHDEKRGWVSEGGDFFLATGRPIRLLAK